MLEKILASLVGFDTVQDKMNKEINQWIANFLQPLGFKVVFIGGKKKNLVATLNLGKDKTITFSGHTDTVPASGNWKSDPWKLKSVGDKMIGLGACDMKGGIAAVLAAVKEAGRKRIGKNVQLIFTYDEEGKFGGVKSLLATNKLQPGRIIIPEPTDMAPVSATKGVIGIKITIYGLSAHSSSPELGKNAALELFKFYEALQAKAKKYKSKKQGIFVSSKPTINLSTVQAGDASNKVPDKCQAFFDIRFINDDDAVWIGQAFKEIAVEKGIKMKIEESCKLWSMVNRDQKFVSEIEKLAGQLAASQNYTTEGSFYIRSGWSPVVIGPGPMTAHQPNEYVSRKSLEKAKKLYMDLLA